MRVEVNPQLSLRLILYFLLYGPSSSGTKNYALEEYKLRLPRPHKSSSNPRLFEATGGLVRSPVCRGGVDSIARRLPAVSRPEAGAEGIEDRLRRGTASCGRGSVGGAAYFGMTA